MENKDWIKKNYRIYYGKDEVWHYKREYIDKAYKSYLKQTKLDLKKGRLINKKLSKAEFKEAMEEALVSQMEGKSPKGSSTKIVLQENYVVKTGLRTQKKFEKIFKDDPTKYKKSNSFGQNMHEYIKEQFDNGNYFHKNDNIYDQDGSFIY